MLFELEGFEDGTEDRDFESNHSGDSDALCSLPSLSIESLFQVANQTWRLSLETLSDFLGGLETPDGGESSTLLDDALPASVRGVSVGDAFAVEELKLYLLAVKCSWTESETKEVIRLLQDPSFHTRRVGADLNSRV